MTKEDIYSLPDIFVAFSQYQGAIKNVISAVQYLQMAQEGFQIVKAKSPELANILDGTIEEVEQSLEILNGQFAGETADEEAPAAEKFLAPHEATIREGYRKLYEFAKADQMLNLPEELFQH